MKMIVLHIAQTCTVPLLQGQRIEELHKMVYLDNRRYLPKGHKLRIDKSGFYTKEVEEQNQPLKKVYQDLRPYHTAYDNGTEPVKA